MSSPSVHRRSAGFAGTLSPAACLSDPSGASPVAADADMVLASQFAGSDLSVFLRPASGWSGTVTPSADLQDSAGASLESPSMSGRTIAAVTAGNGTDVVDIFTEPAGGWFGLIHPTAVLSIPGGVASARLSGNTLTVVGAGETVNPETLLSRAPLYVLHRPVAGWQALGTVHPAAFVLSESGQDNTDFAPALAAPPGPAIALSYVTTCSDQGSPPCEGSFIAINGLASAMGAPARLPLSGSTLKLGETLDGTPPAIAGRTLAVGASGVHFYTIARNAPARVTAAMLSGLTGRRPRPTLRLSVAAGARGAALASVRVLIPAGLGGSGQPRTIAFSPRRRAVTVTIRGLRPDPELRTTIERITARGGRTALTVPVQVTDAAGRSGDSQVRLTLTR